MDNEYTHTLVQTSFTSVTLFLQCFLLSFFSSLIDHDNQHKNTTENYLHLLIPSSHSVSQPLCPSPTSRGLTGSPTQPLHRGCPSPMLFLHLFSQLCTCVHPAVPLTNSYSGNDSKHCVRSPSCLSAVSKLSLHFNTKWCLL